MDKNDKDLLNKEYGDRFQKHLLEQYKLFVGTSLDVTSKRLESNKFHLTLNSVVLGFTSYMTILNQHFVIVLFSAIGMLISFVWVKNILAYRELNRAKFEVIHKLEICLPARLFKYEEECYLDKYHGLTSLEKFYPIIFIILYSTLIIFSMLSALGYQLPFNTT